MPRVIHIVPSFVDLDSESGGVANVVRQLARQAADAGVDVQIICGDHELYNRKGQEGVAKIGSIQRTVVRQYPVPQFGPAGELRSWIRRTARISGPVVAHVHTCFSVFSESAMRELKKLNVPFVFSPHGKLSTGMLSTHSAPKRVWWRTYGQRSASGASRFGALAEAEMRDMQMMGLHGSYCVIPNGYSVMGAPSPVSPLARPYVLFLGYLDPRKQPDLLIKAYAQSRAKDLVDLVLAGPDKYGMRSSLEALVACSDIKNRVHFTGAAYGQKKVDLLGHALVMCLPSKAEGLPLVLCEAIGANLPAIYSVECNFPEIAATGAGRELSCNASPMTWAAAIDDVCLDEKLQARMRGSLRTLSSNYDWRTLSDRWVGVYQEVTNEHAAKARGA